MASLAYLWRAAFLFAAFVMGVYAIRHYLFSVFRMYLKTPVDYAAVEGFFLPRITIIVPMHNEEQVAGEILAALVETDYDPNLLEVLAVNDRSKYSTGQIIDDFAARFPMVRALHRNTGNGGKPAALEFATSQARGDIILF